jgi:PhzF family phenazine biosynthesis protein
MKLRTFIIDAFTDELFKGNPAGVVLLDKELDAATMQSIASEINLSETAFLLQSLSNKSDFSIRYFTPTVEIAFCGHATLASSKLILHRLGLSNVDFTTHHNLKLSAMSDGKHIAMKFPLYDTVEYKPNQALYDAFGITNPVATQFSKDVNMLLVEVKDNNAVKAISPDYAKALTAGSFNNLIITARSTDNEFDFYSRCFCPWIGINEDPVTGASHTVLAKYWGDILGKKEMSAWQSSKRGGYLNLKIVSDTELEVRSNAQIVFEGTMDLAPASPTNKTGV